MLQSIKLKNAASYDSNGIDITELKKINFIYGANGSGKTTLTKLIADPAAIIFKDSYLKWKNDLPVRALVYNREFKEKNFGKGSIDGVFTLGQATNEEIQAIEQMKVELEKIKENGVKRKQARDKIVSERDEHANSFKEIVWSVLYKEYEYDFKEAFKGVMKKEAFRDKLIQQHTANKAKELSYETLKKNAETIFGERPAILLPISTFSFELLTEIEALNIWSKKIVGKADVSIGNLIQALNINDWVSEGRAYIQDGSDICPFCQHKSITDSFRQQLEDYFDETYANDLASIKLAEEEYARLSANISNLLDQIEQNEKGKSLSKIDIERLSAFVRTAQSQLRTNTELLHAKIKEPSRSISLSDTSIQLQEISDLITAANKEIDKHNNIVNNFDKARELLVLSIWKFLTVTYNSEILEYLKRQADYQKAYDSLHKQYIEQTDLYRELEKKIQHANKNVTSVQPTVDEINRLLKSFGFVNFAIVPSKDNENQYQIHREDGSIAESTLSEGEITFITFLYYLQLAKGGLNAENVSEERILVIDDPISSLDSNILFVVSSLLKRIIREVRENKGNIRQLILLTHNVYFHKEVSFIDGRTTELKDTYYWILRKKGKISTIQPYEMKNPIQNSYGLLWQELKNRENNSGVSVQNTMRRIIENYFKILGKYGDDDLIQAFESQEEQEICRSLICWINDGSHTIPDDLYIEHNDAIVDKYFQVFEGIFHKLGHPEHYKMMMAN